MEIVSKLLLLFYTLLWPF